MEIVNSRISNYQQYNYNTITGMQNSNINTKKHDNFYSDIKFTSSPISAATPNITSSVPSFRAEFITDNEKKKYTTLLGMTDKNGRKQLEYLLKTGILLNSNSNDSSSVLDMRHSAS